MKTTLKELKEVLKKNNIIFESSDNVNKGFINYYMNDSLFKSSTWPIVVFIDAYKTNNTLNICNELLLFSGEYHKNRKYDNIIFKYYLTDFNQEIDIIIRDYYDIYCKKIKNDKLDKLIEVIQLLPLTNIAGSEYKKAEKEFTELLNN